MYSPNAREERRKRARPEGLRSDQAVRTEHGTVEEVMQTQRRQIIRLQERTEEDSNRLRRQLMLQRDKTHDHERRGRQLRFALDDQEITNKRQKEVIDKLLYTEQGRAQMEEAVQRLHRDPRYAEYNLNTTPGTP